MPRFSDTLMEHFQDPRHRGTLEDATHQGLVGVPGAGPFFLLNLRVDDGVIVDGAFECHGCGVTIACGSLLMEWILGQPLASLNQCTVDELSCRAGGIPLDKRHSPEVAIQAAQSVKELPCRV